VELYRVRRSDWCALEYACQNVGGGLADDDCQQTLRETSELFVTKSKVEREDRGLQEAQTSVVEDGGQPDGLEDEGLAKTLRSRCSHGHVPVCSVPGCVCLSS
jgi:hypothetical protein